MMYAQRKTIWMTILIAFLCVGCFILLPKGASAETFFVSDKTMDYTTSDRKTTITGSNMVWMGDDNEGYYQVFTRNLETGEQKQVTTAKTFKETLYASGDYAVYLEDRQNIILLNLQTGETIAASIEPYYYRELRTDGRYIIYHNSRGRMIYVYDVSTKETKPIGKGRSPVIVDGVVVYYNESEDSIELYNANNGTTRRLEGKVNVASIGFNGKVVLWAQGSRGPYLTLMLNIEEEDPEPQVLSIVQEVNPFDPIAVGTNIAAWHDNENGAVKITAADLATRQTGVVSDDQYLIGIYQDQLILKDKNNNKVVQRSLQLTGQGQAITDIFISAVPDIDKRPYPVTGSLEAGTGLQVATDDKSVIVSKADAYSEPKRLNIEIAYAEDKDFTLTKALQPGQKMVSHPWEVTFEYADQPVKLSMTYMKERVPKGLVNKLGVYRLESGVWTYVGGLFDQDGRLYADVIKPGIYSVLYYDVPNSFVRDYWRERRIEQLNTNAPIRVFLDGEELNFHQAPVLRDGSTAVEFRPIFEKLGMQVDWDEASQSVTGVKEGQTLLLKLGQTEATVNGTTAEMPVSPFLNEGYTFVPLRFVGEATGRKVLWDANLKAVYIYDPATEGKLYYKSGTLMYEGQLKNGLMHGKGKLYHEDGTLWYDAEFRDNEVNGWGTIYFSGWSRERDRTGEVTIGQFEDGRPAGYVISLNDSSFVSYEGQVIQGFFNGKGKYYIDGQLIYDGEFKDNLFDGYGKHYTGGKLDFEGHFVKNIPNGYGKSYWMRDGVVMEEGEYVNGVLHGKGISYYLRSGAKSYEGEFVNGRKSNGTFYYSDGKVKAECSLKEDGTRTGTIYYTNGERYVGEFIEVWVGSLARDGQGTLYDKDGNVIYQGKYQNNQPQP